VATTPTRTLADGDRVGSLRVVAAPGHTVGQIALVDERDGTLICGDAYSTLGGVATTARVNWRFPIPGMATWNRPTALRTARELRQLEPTRLAPGHGRVVTDPLAPMDQAIARGA
jgi:glyoxylase-like metal-dependent hydrolase (beta-lactamase superfamily II)